MSKAVELVSVIIPVYNVENYVADCLESVISQTYKNLEIIIVDDGSPDNSEKIYKKFAKKDKRIKIVKQENKGLNGARETGFRNSNGNFITFVDSDDMIHPEFIEKMLNLMTENVDISVCGYENFTDKITPSKIGENLRILQKSEFIPAWIREDFSSPNIFPQTAWGKLFRRFVIEKINWEASNYRTNEDEFMSAMFYSAVKNSVAILDEKMYFYRKNPTSITASYAKKEYKNSYNGEKITRGKLFENIMKLRLELFPDYEEEIVFIFASQFLHFLQTKLLAGKTDFSEEEAIFRNHEEQIRKMLKNRQIGGYRGKILDFCLKNDMKNIAKWYEKMSLISIIVPVYNVEKYLVDCINSLIYQNYFKLEILLIDDGSKDNSGEICDKFASLDARIKVYHLENGGVSKARNFAINLATGDYLCFVDSDDFLPENAIEKMVDLTSNGEIEIVNANLTFKIGDIFEKRNSPAVINNQIFSKETLDEKGLLSFWDGLNSPVSKLYRTDLIKKNGLKFPENIKIGEDLVFVIKSLLLAEKIYSIDDPLYFYRRDNENSATKNYESMKFEIGKALLEIDKFIKENNFSEDVLRASKAGVVKHSYYAFSCLKNDFASLKEVFEYFKNDLWKKLEISENIENLHYEELQRLKDILDSQNFYDFLARQIDFYKKEIEERDRIIAHLDNQILILQSIRGSAKNFAKGGIKLLKKIARKVKR